MTTVAGKVLKRKRLTSYKFAGAGSLSSAAQNATTQLDGSPAAVPVFILEASTFELAFFINSESDGSWSVPFIDANFEYIAIARDTTKTLNSAVKDWMAPAV